jgi:alpha-N-arabinofuranosidase
MVGPAARVVVMVGLISLSGRVGAQSTLTVQVDKPGASIDPMFYGLMTEEINYSYDGGLYAELIRNRIFQDRTGAGGGRGNRGGAPAPQTPVNPAVEKNPNLINWWLVNSEGADGSIDIDTNDPVNTTALTNSLKLQITKVGAGQRVGVANTGYWGIPARANTEYTASFYARTSPGFSGPLTVAIEGNNGTVYASGQVSGLSNAWKKYTLKIKTAQITPTADARFIISASSPGTVWLSLVSLFQPTYKNRANGMRADLMELLAGMKPQFLRFPGGNYLEGNNFENRFNWKATIGPIEERKGHMSPWGYRSTDGVGLLEFLYWCEDLGMEPIVGIYAGMHLDQGRTTITGDALKPFVEEGLQEIEYVMGDASTEWGARRAKDGHPAPFKLRYVEIGNEDWLNNGKANYAERFKMFYDAIKAKYPQIKIISTMRSQDRFDHGVTPDLLDDHDYMTIPQALGNVHRYDTFPRTAGAPKIFCGEWATNSPRTGNTPMMAFALGDAAWLTGLEQNADIVTMNCYAPLLVNVNPGGQQWAVNLIGYDAVSSYGSPSYYVQKMFSNNRGDVILPAKFDPLPQLTLEQIPQAPVPANAGGRGFAGGRGPASGPATRPAANGARRGGARGPQGPQGPFDGLYASATRDNATGDIILKLVNIQATAQALNIDLQGATSVNAQAQGEQLTGELGGVNSVAEPTKFVPKTITVANAAPRFSHELPPHSVTVLRLKTR